MKAYVKPTIDIIVLKPEEQIAAPMSCVPKRKGNNGHGNGDQDAPGNSLHHNNAENAQGPKGNKHKR